MPRYTTRQDLPYLIELGRDTVLTAPVYLDGELVAATSATVAVTDQNGTAVTADAVTVPGGIATTTVQNTTSDDYEPSTGWKVQWTITLTGGDIVTPRSTAYLVRHRLYPTISDIDIGRRVPALAVTLPGRATVATNYQSMIEEADTEIQRRLINLGKRPWLIMDAWALRECWLTLTIALIYDALVATAGADSPYVERGKHFRDQFEAAWTEAKVQIDWDDDGSVDSTARTAVKSSGVWLQ